MAVPARAVLMDTPAVPVGDVPAPAAKTSWRPSRKAVAGFVTAGLAAIVGVSTLSGAHDLTITSGLIAVLTPLVPAITFYLVPPTG